MSKFTPGPWSIHIDKGGSFDGWVDHGGVRIDAAGIEQLAYVWNMSNRLVIGEAQENGPAFGSCDGEANARLISAAPDMYEALEALVSCITETRGPTADDALHSARAALKKARGE